jgi:hypothetical protein
MVKYTVDYCRRNKIYITTPTLEIFKKVVTILKCKSVLKDSYWNIYKARTYVGYYSYDDPCYGSTTVNNTIISHEQFFKDNNIETNNIYELW